MRPARLKIASAANAIAMRAKADGASVKPLLDAVALADRAWDEIGATDPLTVAIGQFVARASPARRDPERVVELANELQRAVLTLLRPEVVGAERSDIHG